MIADNQETFFKEYHDMVWSRNHTLDSLLGYLREGYKVFPENRKRITDMANVLKIGMRKRPPMEKPVLSDLEKNVMETML